MIAWKVGKPFINSLPRSSSTLWIYLYVVCVKVLHPYFKYSVKTTFNILKNLISEKSINYGITDTGVFQVFGEKYIYSLPTSDDQLISLKKSYSNYKMLAENDLTSSLVDYSQCLLDCDFFCVKTEILLPSSDDLQILPLQHKLHAPCKSNQDFVGCLKLEMINYFKEHSLDYHCSSIFFEDMSVIHGDLTPDNVMINSSGKAVIIDLDCLAVCGPRVYDEIHYLVQSEVVRSGANWLGVVEAMLRNKHIYHADLLKTYVYFRVFIEGLEKHTFTFRYRLKNFYKRNCST